MDVNSNSIPVDDELTLKTSKSNVHQSSVNPSSREEKEERLFLKSQRIQSVEDQLILKFKMRNYHMKIQDLEEILEQEKLMNLQYQLQYQKLVLKFEEVRAQLVAEKCLKRKSDSADDTPSIKRPDNSTISTPDKSKPDEQLRSIRHQNSILLQEREDLLKNKEEIRQHNIKLIDKLNRSETNYQTCYNYYTQMKKNYLAATKERDEFKEMKVNDLTKDPRVLSMIERDKMKEIQQLKAEIDALNARLKQYQPHNIEMDVNNLKKERSISDVTNSHQIEPANDMMIKEINELKEKLNKYKLYHNKQEANQKILEDTLKKKTEQIKFIEEQNKNYCQTLNLLKNEAIKLNEEKEELKSEIEEKSIEIDRLKAEKLKNESQVQQSIKDIEHNFGLKKLELLNEHENKMNQKETDHSKELEILRSRLNDEHLIAQSSTKEMIDKLKSEIETLNGKLQFDEIELTKYKSLHDTYQEESQKSMLRADQLRELTEKNKILSDLNSLMKENLDDRDEKLAYYDGQIKDRNTLILKLASHLSLDARQLPQMLQQLQTSRLASNISQSLTRQQSPIQSNHPTPTQSPHHPSPPLQGPVGGHQNMYQNNFAQVPTIPLHPISTSKMNPVFITMNPGLNSGTLGPPTYFQFQKQQQQSSFSNPSLRINVNHSNMTLSSPSNGSINSQAPNLMIPVSNNTTMTSSSNNSINSPVQTPNTMASMSKNTIVPNNTSTDSKKS